MVRGTDHTAPRYVVFSTPLSPRPSRPKYLPQYPILKHLQPMSLTPTSQTTSSGARATNTSYVKCISVSAPLLFRRTEAKRCEYTGTLKNKRPT